MADFKPHCRHCFIAKGQSILLVEKNGELTCPINSSHKYKNDVQVA